MASPLQRAALQFDVATSVSLVSSMSGVDHRPPPDVASLVVAPHPSEYFTADDLTALRCDGFDVRLIEGAGHTVWYGHLDAFMSAISSWL